MPEDTNQNTQSQESKTENPTPATTQPPVSDGSMEAESPFNIKKPKDIRDGLLHGTSNIIKGLYLFCFLFLW